MTNDFEQLSEFHWMLDMLQNINVGLVVLNRQIEVQVWNAFMENHGITSSKARDLKLFDLFRAILVNWLQRKVEPVFQLRTRAFSA